MNYPTLSSTQIQQLANLNIPSYRWSEYKDFSYNISLWSDFYLYDFYLNFPSKPILDFGCGATWGSFVGSFYNYSITNLDIDTEEVRASFGSYAQILNQKVQYYDGKSMPFNDSHFGAIISKASILKLEESDFESVITELIRISCNDSIWFVSSKGMCRTFKSRLRNYPFLHSQLLKKNITLKCWTWRPFEFIRSKSPFTEFSILYYPLLFLTKVKKYFLTSDTN